MTGSAFTFLGDGAGAADLSAGLAPKAQRLTVTATKTSTYTAAANELVICDATSGGFTVTLPSAGAGTAGNVVSVRRIEFGGNTITIARAGSDTIGGATSVSLVSTEGLTLVSNGAGLWTIQATSQSLTSLDPRYRLTTTAVKTSNYTAAAGELVRCNTTAASLTVTLPAANSAGQQVAVKLLATSGAFLVTVTRAGSDTINNGVTSVVLTLADEAVVFTSNGSGVWTTAATQPSAVTVTSIGEPIYIAHRGGANVYPESTMEAFRSVVSASCRAIEPDVWTLADGGLGVMHDSTVDRTTTASATVSDLTTATWQQLVVDAGSWLGGGWPSTLKAPLFHDVLREFGGKVVLVPEAKDASAVGRIASLVVQYGLQRSVLLQSFFGGATLYAAAAKGVPCIFMSGGSEPDYTDLLANGVRYVGFSTAQSTTWVSNAVAAGMKVLIYTPSRQYERDAYLALGVHGFFSDDPVYLAGIQAAATYRRTTDPWKSQTWYHGHIASTAGVRGAFTSPNWWGFAANTQFQGVLAGWASPLVDGSTFTINTDIILDSVNAGDTTRWLSIFVSTSDRPWDNASASGVNGYHALWRANGQVDLFRVDNGVSTTIGSVGSTPPTLGTTVAQLRLTVTPTTVTWQRLDVAASTGAVASTTYRPVPYVHLSTSSAAGRFRSMAIT